MSPFVIAACLTVSVIILELLSNFLAYIKTSSNINKIVKLLATIIVCTVLPNVLNAKTAEDYFIEQRNLHNMKIDFQTKDKIRTTVPEHLAKNEINLKLLEKYPSVEVIDIIINNNASSMFDVDLKNCIENFRNKGSKASQEELDYKCMSTKQRKIQHMKLAKNPRYSFYNIYKNELEDRKPIKGYENLLKLFNDPNLRSQDITNITIIKDHSHKKVYAIIEDNCLQVEVQTSPNAVVSMQHLSSKFILMKDLISRLGYTKVRMLNHYMDIGVIKPDLFDF